MALRVYGDTSPPNLKTALLQKGLILVFKNEEVVEEGLGFGVPVVEYPDHTYFAGKAKVFIDHQLNLIHIYFLMDTVNTNKITNHIFLKQLKRGLNLLYKRSHRYRTMIAPLIKWRANTKIGTNRFYRVEQQGEVHVTYKIQGHCIYVTADLSQLANWQTVTLLNEQGALTFTRYSDTSGRNMTNDEIGVWDRVFASRATLKSLDNNISFEVSSSQSCVLRRGRELQNGYLSWAGLAYEITPPQTHFHYSIHLRANQP